MRSAQYVAEFAILLGVVLAALIGMQSYAQRSLQAKVKTTVDASVSAINNALPRLDVTYGAADLLAQRIENCNYGCAADYPLAYDPTNLTKCTTICTERYASTSAKKYMQYEPYYVNETTEVFAQDSAQIDEQDDGTGKEGGVVSKTSASKSAVRSTSVSGFDNSKDDQRWK